jgi:tape measure domain-containing protein
MALERVGVIFVARNVGAFLKSTGQANDGLMRLRNNLVYTQREFTNAGRSGNQLSNTLSTGLGTALGVTIVYAAEAAIRSITSLTRYVGNTISFFERFEISLEQFSALELEATGATDDFATALEMAGEPAEKLMRWIEKAAVMSPFSVKNIADAYRTAIAYNFTTAEAVRLTQAVTDLVSVTGLGADYVSRINLAIGQMAAMGRFGGQEIRQLSEAGIPVLRILADEFEVTTQRAKEMAEQGIVPMSQGLNAVLEFIEQRAAGGGERVANTFSGLITSIKDAALFAARDIFMPIADAIRPVLMSIRDALTDPGVRNAMEQFGQIMHDYVATSIEAVYERIKTLIAWWNGLSQETREAIITFGLFATAAFAAGVALGALVIALRLVLNPLTMVSAAVAFLATAMTTELGGAFKFVRDLLNDIAQTFRDTADEAYEWGYNITEMVARGLIAGANLIVRAINAIAKIFEYWMAPGSPPRFLPDLTEWGKGTADAYLEGWTQADFDILNSLYSDISGFIQSFMKIGGAEDVDINRRLQTVLPALASAVDDINRSGRVMESTYDGLRRATAGLGEEMTTLVDLSLAYVETLEDTERTQDRLNKLTKKYDELLKPLQRDLEKISNLEQDAEDAVRIRELQNVIANAGTTQGEKEAAAMEIRRIRAEKILRDRMLERDVAVDAAQQEVDAAQERQDAAEAELNIFESRLETQKTMLDLMAKEQDILAKVGSSSSKKGKKGKPTVDLDVDISGGKTIDDFLGDLEESAENVQGAFSGVQGAFANFAAAIAPLREAWDGLNTSVGNFLGKWAVAQAAFTLSAETLEPAISSMSELEGPFARLLVTVSNLGVAWGTVADEFGKFRVHYILWNQTREQIDWDKVAEDTGKLSTKTAELGVNMLKLFYATSFTIGKLYGLGPALEDADSAASDNVWEPVELISGALDWLNDRLEQLIELLGRASISLENFWRGPFSGGMSFIGIQNRFPTSSEGRQEPPFNLGGPTGLEGTLAPGMQGPLTQAAQDAREATRQIWEGWQTDTGEFIEKEKTAWQRFADWLFNRSLVPDLAQNVVQEFKDMGDLIVENTKTMRTILQAVWIGIKEDITAQVTDSIWNEEIGVIPQFQGLLDYLSDEEYVKKWKTMGFDLGYALGKGVEMGAKKAIAGLAAGIIEATEKALAKVRAKYDVDSPSKVFAGELGEPFGAGITEGMLGEIDYLAESVNKRLRDQMRYIAIDSMKFAGHLMRETPYMTSVAASTPNTVINNNFNLYAPTTAEHAAVLRQFRSMQAMVGVY